MRKSFLRFQSVIVVMVMAMVMLFAGCDSMDPSMKVTVDGAEFQLGCKVSEVLDAGFELAGIDHRNGILKEYPDMEARSLTTSSIYLFKGGKPSHVAIYVCNKGTSSARFEECTVYGFKYDCGDYAHDKDETGYLDVTFNGIDARFADRNSVISSLEDQGFKFKDAEKTDFLKENDAYSKSLISATGMFGHDLTVYNNYDYNTGNRYVNSIEYKEKLAYDTSGAWSEPK